MRTWTASNIRPPNAQRSTRPPITEPTIPNVPTVRDPDELSAAESEAVGFLTILVMVNTSPGAAPDELCTCRMIDASEMVAGGVALDEVVVRVTAVERVVVVDATVSDTRRDEVCAGGVAVEPKAGRPVKPAWMH